MKNQENINQEDIKEVQLNIDEVRILLSNFINWYNNDEDTNNELYNEDIELFISYILNKNKKK